MHKLVHLIKHLLSQLMITTRRQQPLQVQIILWQLMILIQAPLHPSRVEIRKQEHNITFTTPFTWDGTSNILIQTCFDNGNTTSAIDVLQGTAAPLGVGTKATAINATNGGASAGCSLTGGGVSDSRPQFRFTQAVPQTPIESALNATRSFYLGPNADVYLYSDADCELIARIQNLSSHDY